MSVVTVVVTRPELGLSDLDITASPYRLGSPDQDLELGTTTWIRDYARSPDLHGATLVSAKRDIVDGCTIDVDVTAADQTEMRTNVDALVAAFEQWSYVLTVTLDGVTRSWRCDPADHSEGILDVANTFGLIVPVRLVFNRSPIRVSVPDAPTIGTATSGAGYATAAWNAPVNTGGAPIIDYQIRWYRASDNAVVVSAATATSSPFTVVGFTAGVPVYCKVKARNAVGFGAYSAASNTVTPT